MFIFRSFLFVGNKLPFEGFSYLFLWISFMDGERLDV